MSLALSGNVVDSSAGQSRRGPMSFAEQSGSVRIFIAATIVASIAAMILQPTGHGYAHPLIFLSLLAASAVASIFKVDLPLAHQGATLSSSFAFEFAALLLIGPHATMVIAAASAWLQCTVGTRDRNPLHRTVFSMAAVTVTSLVAGLVYRQLGGTPASMAPALVGLEKPIAAAGITYFLVNTLLVTTAVGLETRQPLRKIWNDHIVWSALGYFVGGGVAALGVFLVTGTGIWLAPLLIVPLYFTFSTYRLYFERMNTDQQRVRELSNLHLATIEALALAIDAKDRTATSHIRRVQVYASGIAEAMGMAADEVEGLKTAALLHDIGKLAVPEHILSKPGPLTQEEFQRMKIHPQLGAEILENVPFPYPVVPLVRCHHERWDGKGYPAGLSGDQIPLGARILAAVDCFDALTSERPLHAALTPEAAFEILRQEAGRALDPAVVDVLVQLQPELESAAAAQAEPAHHFSFATPERRLIAPTGQRSEAPRKTVFEDIAFAHREIYALYEIAQSMGTSLGVADTMALIASKLSTLIPFSTCALYLQEESGDLLRCRFATGVDAELLQPLAIMSGEGLVGWVGRNQRALVNARPSADLEAGGQPDATALQSALVCPLLLNDQLIGTIALYHTEPGCYTDDHRRLLERVAEQAAAVVNNSILFEQTKRDSLTDPLTGLPNTRFMFVHLTRELARAERLDTEVSLLVMDLDGFKEINDSHGHHIGDKALREVARVLRNGIRPYDICVRYAGDEFVVVLSGCGAIEAEQKQRELQKTIAEICFEVRPGKTVQLGGSFGYAVFPRDGQAYESLLSTADRRMYQDKAARKGRADVPAETAPAPEAASTTPRPSVFAKMPRRPTVDRAH
jgi:diguanylate cyclase (GGDEF)-like protein/putative nucleotidyltransferase with HDIG domain